MVDKKPLVLVLGATGRTGRRVVDSLLESGQYNVAALTRSSSASKPEVDALRSRGVEIRFGDYEADPPSKLSAYVAGVDVLVSALSILAITEQKPIFKAAVDVGVKRIIPCDFGTPGARGIRDAHDLKLDVREYLEGLCSASNGASAYTFIDIDEYYTEDDKLMLLTDIDHVGPYVARIIGDPRTANQYVIVWEDELSLKESREIAEAASGEAQALKARRVVLDRKALEQRAAESKARYIESGNDMVHALWTFSEYMISIHFLGENSLANAKKLGALDAHALYPDIVTTRFADFAKGFYEKGTGK